MVSISANQDLARAAELHNRGDLDAAAAIYRRVLDYDAANADALHLLGVVHYQHGDYDDAARLIELAIDSKPGIADFHSNLANAYQDNSDFVRAELNYNKALGLDPAHVNALNGLANVLAAVGQPRRAAEILVEAGKRIGPQPLLLATLGNTYVKLKLDDEALACYDRSLEIEPGQVLVLLNEARTLRRLELTEQACDCYRRILERDPTHVDAVYELAGLLGDGGDFDEAVSLYELVLDTDPKHVRACRNLTFARKWTSSDTAHHSRIERAMTGAAAADRAQLHFALGKYFDDRGDYDEAFANFQTGNSIINLGYDRRSNEMFINAGVETHKSRKQNGIKPVGHPSRRPVFVVGMPRSGTTLVEQILSRHPDIVSVGERLELDELSRGLQNSLGHPSSYPYCLEAMTGAAARETARQYLDKLDSAASRIARSKGAERPKHALRVVDKLPHNFLHIGLIEALFPNATIIHCRRNPLDTCLSCYFQFFFQAMSFSFDLNDLVHYYRLYERAMEYWCRESGIDILDVVYEKLVDNPSSEARRMLEHCGIAWDERCVDHTRNVRSVKTSSRWQVRQPIYKTSVARWKNYREHIGVLLDAFATGKTTSVKT